MKLSQIILVIAIGLFTHCAMMGQENVKIDPVGFGGPSIVNTTLAGSWTIETGGLGAGFIKKNLYLGGGGFGLTQKKDEYEYGMAYGGIMLGYLWHGDKSTSLNFYGLTGYGGISETDNETIENSSGFWFIKPTIEVEFSVAKWFHIGVGGGYRFVKGTDLSTINDGDISAPFGSITFRFGNWGY